jgi:hypothetical protein
MAEFDLTVTSLTAGGSRRFFLTGKLAGTALTGTTFGARPNGVVTATPPSGGTTSGFPTPASVALVIDTPVLGVSNAPEQPMTVTHAGGTAAQVIAGRFRISALNGPATVSGITLTTSGTGDWSTDVDSTAGVMVYRDNGDETFSAASDTLLFQGGGAATVPVVFVAPLTLAGAEVTDLWIVIGLTSTAGIGVSAAPETFQVAIAAATDISASVPAVLGMIAPVGVAIGAIEFAVSGFTPLSASTSGGDVITISGSGFVAPFYITIGGTICPGTPVFSGGTQVTGVNVPAGAGSDLPIVVHSGALPPQTLAMTFDYIPPKDSGPPSGDDGSNCSAGGSSGLLALVALAMLGLAALARRQFV